MNNILFERGINKITPFIIVSKRIKYLAIHLTRKMKDLHTEYNKSLMKIIKEDINIYKKNTLCSWIRRLNFVNMSILAKAIYRVNTSPKGILRKNGKAGSTSFPNS